MESSIGVGIASFGMSGKVFHAPLLTHHNGFRLVHIVERSTNDAGTLYPAARVSRSIEELLNNSEVELVVVNTPDQTHVEIAKRCLDAGKHVIVEKPFTQSIAQGEDLIRLALRYGKLLTVFQNRRWDGDFLTVKRIVQRELLGHLVDYESHFDRYRNYIQAGTWKEEQSSGSGLLYNLGSHLIDQALVLFGIPEAVTAHIRTMRTGGEVDDWFEVRLHYRHQNVVVKSSYLVREQGPRFILHGTQGSFIKSGLDPQEEALKQGGRPGAEGWGKESQEWWGLLHTEVAGKTKRAVVETLPGNYSAFYDNVFDCIRTGAAPAVKPEEALNVIRVIEAAKESSNARKTVVL